MLKRGEPRQILQRLGSLAFQHFQPGADEGLFLGAQTRDGIAGQVVALTIDRFNPGFGAGDETAVERHALASDRLRTWNATARTDGSASNIPLIRGPTTTAPGPPPVHPARIPIA